MRAKSLKELIFVVPLAAFLWGTARLLAAPVAGPDEVGKEFVAYLARRDFESLRNVIARDSFDLLGEEGVNDVLNDLRLVPGSYSTTTDGATAQVTPIFSPQPITCRREGRFWRVDLIATASRWLSATDEKRLLRHYSTLPFFGEEAQQLCNSNLKAIGVALRQYAEDYDDTLPPANLWTDALTPYVRDAKVFHCPSAGKRNFGYAMNWKLSKRPRTQVIPQGNAAPPAMIYETHERKPNANRDGADLVFRHENTSQTLFADGTVRATPKGNSIEFRLPPGK
jgi:hypothetical protein